MKEPRLTYAYFSVYNREKGRAEVYQMVTQPFGVTHSVYCFLWFAKMLRFIATRGLFLMNANFYDDFVLLWRQEIRDSANHACNGIGITVLRYS